MRTWQLAARLTTAAVGLASVALWAADTRLLGPWLAAAALPAAALALLALMPARGPQLFRLPRWTGYPAAAFLLCVGVVPRGGWPSHPFLPVTNHLCFAVLGASLLLKPLLPKLAVTADMFVAFVGFAMLLDYLFDATRVIAPPAHPMTLATSVAVLLLAGAWMAAWPQNRPVSFYLEDGAAASVMRRLLPATLVFPVLLVALNSARAHGYTLTARVTEMVIVYGTLACGAALLWLMTHELDRRDTMNRIASLELRASEQRYRLQFENNPQPMWIFSVASLRFLAVNDSAVREFGYTREEFLRMTVLDVRPTEDHARVRAVVAGAQPAKGWLWRYHTKSQEPLEAEVFAQPIDWHGEPAFLSFLHDVTARRRAERELHEQQERVRTLLDSTKEGIYTLDLEGRCDWCNPAAAAQLGWSSPAEVVGKSMHALAHHTHANGQPYLAEECLLVRSIAGGGSVNLDEEPLWRADGTRFPADIRSSPLYRAGQLAGAVLAIADVSERSSLRAQVQQAQKMEAVGRLAAGIAHDFNNLLTVINGYSDMLLLAHPEPPSTPAAPNSFRTKVTSIRQAGERAASLTQQLLAFSRQQVVQPRQLDLNAVLEEMDPLMRRVLGEDLELATVCNPGLGAVHADPGQIGQVLMNLVVNARDAMPTGGRITIETANVQLDERYAAGHPGVTAGDYVMLAVSDTGTGMDTETQSHIFEPFFTTKPVGKGTGLGLATVFGIAKQSGGTVGVYSEPGRGTSMKVYLPRQTATDAMQHRRPAAPVPRGRETVLVVEDEDAVRDLMQESLQSYGYRVLVAARPSEALRLLHQSGPSPELVITDVVMPEMDGRRLVSQIQRLRPGIAVLYASGYPDRAVAQHRTLEPNVAFIQKPFAPSVLAAKVRAVLDVPRGRAQAGVA
ncbi:MAG: PAS domain S-box protein [Terriglobales bacterium]